MASKESKKRINREISWLSFNERVLQEAEDVRNPLLERIKFLGIFSNNQDEFFRVRVDTLKKLSKVAVEARKILFANPHDLLDEIHEIVLQLRDRFEKAYNEILQSLEKEHIFIINEKQLNERQGKYVKNYFQTKVRPTLYPIMLGDIQKFPALKDQTIYLAIRLVKIIDINRNINYYSAIEIPTHILDRFIILPSDGNQQHIILLDDVIRYNLKDIYPIYDFDYAEAYTIKVTRGSELDLDEDLNVHILEAIKKSLKKRKRSDPTRLVFDKSMPEDFKDFIVQKMNLKKRDAIISGGRYHNFKDFINFPNLKRPELSLTPTPILWHPLLKSNKSLLSVVRQRDIMLSFPYQSFTHLLDLLREAAIDPRVKSISMTIYRVATQSNIMGALINAVQNGKKVTVVAELQARFDEESNIYWTDRLREEGAKVIYGVKGFKVHAKTLLIERYEKNKTSYYCGIGTGNFNESTAKLYTDNLLLTSDKRICTDVKNLFSFFEDNTSIFNAQFKHLWVAPFTLRNKITALIKKAIRLAKQGKKVELMFKMNSLADVQMEETLYAASKAGVRIKLIVRGICTLICDESPYSENISAISIVDKYLEHSRIFIFNWGNDDTEVFIGSADLMTRNIDYRIEVITPIFDPKVKKTLLDIFEIQWRDNQKARILDKKLSNSYKKMKEGETPQQAQWLLYDYFVDEKE
ncbi:MAG: polyphosphate kinase 1 [Chitinophagales bacterium]|nr:polyphosphate kinase 1 [Bacteroidota bacterium]MCB9043998.1 polyphosphate kinase 1 [Chitinophagales bacterium]